MRIQSLHVHPVKSTAIRTVPAADVLPAGLAGDRRWMVVDGTGAMISARTDRMLLRILARIPEVDGTSGLVLTAPSHEDLLVAEPDGPVEQFTLHSGTVAGVRAGTAAADWVGSVLGRSDVALVWCDDPSRRRLNPEFSLPSDSTAFADAYPVQVATQASLDRLNAWIADTAAQRGEAATTVPMQRFRPNIVLAGSAAPFAEDGWSQLQIGDVTLRAAKPCSRCVLTTIDPDTGRSGHEPIRTLARERRRGSKTYFGMLFIPTGSGRITVGDPVSIG